MADAFTARNYPIRKAPARIELLGDKTIRPEPAQHIIEFPGGAIEVSRTTAGDYWAHIIINHREPFADGSTREQAQGLVVDSRIGYTDGRRIDQVAEMGDVHQLAVLIRAQGVEP